MQATRISIACLLVSAAGACTERPVPPPQTTPAAIVDAAPPRPSRNARLYEDSSLFTWKLPPREGDWLARFHEPGQTFAAYEVSRPVKPTERRRKLVLQPLGTWSPADRELLGKLGEHMEAFFALPVETKAALSLPSTRKRVRREAGRTWVQYETGAIMDEALEKKLPDDAVVYLGITTEDLYPGASWNFVFGQARFEARVGVYSIARMFERFDGRPDTDATRTRGLARSTMVLAHEAGHAFGIAHCTKFECVMNGSNSLEELDRQFAEPCPVCLHKLTWNIGLDPLKRYERLRAFYRREHVDKIASWLDARIAQVAPD